MSLLTIVQDAISVPGLGDKPLTVINNTEPLVAQALSILNRSGKSLTRRYQWEVLTKEVLHTTVAGQDQGRLNSIASDIDGSRIINETVYNRSENLSVNKITPQKWQLFQSTSRVTVFDQYRIRGGKLIMTPEPGAGQTISFEYISKNWVENADGTVEKDAFTIDTDCALLDENLLYLDLVWRLKQHKGLEYAEDFRAFQLELKQMTMTEGGSDVINTSKPDVDARYHIPETGYGQ